MASLQLQNFIICVQGYAVEQNKNRNTFNCIHCFVQSSITEELDSLTALGWEGLQRTKLQQVQSIQVGITQ